jgi:hypothetical protein
MSMFGRMFFGGGQISKLVYTNIEQRSAARRKALAGKPWKFPRKPVRIALREAFEARRS